MKIRILIPIFLFVLASISVGQVAKPPPEKEQSKIEQFSARSGALVEKQFIKIGEFSGIEVEILKVNDLISKTGISGVRLSKTVATSYSTDEKTAFLDSDEVDGLMKSIDLLKTSVFLSAPENYTEVVYTSRGGFSAGAYFSDKKWRAFVKLEKYDSRASFYMSPEEFNKFYELLAQAKSSLK